MGIIVFHAYLHVLHDRDCFLVLSGGLLEYLPNQSFLDISMIGAYYDVHWKIIIFPTNNLYV